MKIHHNTLGVNGLQQQTTPGTVWTPTQASHTVKLVFPIFMLVRSSHDFAASWAVLVVRIVLLETMPSMFPFPVPVNSFSELTEAQKASVKLTFEKTTSHFGLSSGSVFCRAVKYYKHAPNRAVIHPPSLFKSGANFTISAWNPHGRRASSAENLAANRALLTALQSLDPPPSIIFPNREFEADSDWFEEGLTANFSANSPTL